MTRDASAGTLIGSASRKNAVDGLAPSIAADSNTSLGQPAEVVAQQVDRERQAVAGVGQPDGEERAVERDADGVKSRNRLQDRDERRPGAARRAARPR